MAISLSFGGQVWEYFYGHKVEVAMDYTCYSQIVNPEKGEEMDQRERRYFLEEEKVSVGGRSELLNPLSTFPPLFQS